MVNFYSNTPGILKKDGVIPRRVVVFDLWSANNVGLQLVTDERIGLINILSASSAKTKVVQSRLVLIERLIRMSLIELAH